MDFRNINIGKLIKQRVIENSIEMIRICKFLKCKEEEVLKMYETKNIDTEVLLRWSKLLKYDFFRMYSQHLILFSPQTSMEYNVILDKEESPLPQFRKNIYTMEIIKFILEQINTGQLTKIQVMNQYKIPKTTLYKWLSKYNISKEL